MTSKPNPARFVGLRLDDATRERVEALAPYLATRAPIRANFSGAARFLLIDALQRFEGEAKRNAKTAPEPTAAPPAEPTAAESGRFDELARQLAELRAEQTPLREMLARIANALPFDAKPEEALALEAAAVSLHGLQWPPLAVPIPPDQIKPRPSLVPMTSDADLVAAFDAAADLARDTGAAAAAKRARKWSEHTPDAVAARDAVKAALAEARIKGNVNTARDLERRLEARERQVELAAQLDEARRHRDAHFDAGRAVPDALEASIAQLKTAYGGASRFEVE
jgi:hypothetical protein